ncbi:MAG: acyl-CoA thioesterase [Candidatus Methanomethyliaceae archaeon]|nr:acyl-CoA thioesterase [Candidatus Methanomethyliaceae archaeon]
MTNSKRVSESALISTRWMFPSDANPAGNVFGGAIVRYIDEVAAAVAHRHSRRNVVIASMDRMDFHKPVKVGDLLTLKASINYVGNTSMEIGVRVETENLTNGKVIHAASAYCTMVALDDCGRPTRVPRLIPETEDEKRRFREAGLRKKARLKQSTEK